MPVNDFLTFAGDPAANVMAQTDYAAAGFTPRINGFATGTALSVELNKVWRQASLIAAMIGSFTVAETGLDMLDDGSPAGMTTLQSNFVAAVRTVAQGATGGGFLPLAGGTLTGPLTINAASPLQMNAPVGQWVTAGMDRAANQGAQIVATTGGTLRWDWILANNEPETGSNAGSNAAIARYSDAGGFLDIPLSISRATGVVNFAHPPTMNAGPLPYLPIAGGALTGTLSVAGNGISYPTLGLGHYHGLAWDGTNENLYVDGTLQGAIAFKGYVGTQLAGYLPLTGGVLSGALSVQAALYANTAQVIGAMYFAGQSDFLTYASGTGRFAQWATNYWTGFDTGTHAMTWWANGKYMQLDGSANLSASGYVLSIVGRLISQGSSPSVMAYDLASNSAMGFWSNSNGMTFGRTDSSGAPNAGLMTLSAVGAMYMYNTLNVSGQITGGANIVAGASGWVYAANGGGAILTNVGLRTPYGGANDYAFTFNTTYDVLQYAVNGGTTAIQELIGGANTFRVRYLGMTGVNLEWVDNDGSGWFANTFRSDARFKRNIADAEDFDSLAAICATPIRAYEWREDYNMPLVPHGFLASEVRVMLPDCVVQAPSLEGDPVDHLEPSALLAHIFRAIRQLNDKVEALHG